MSIERLIRTKLEAHYATSGKDISWLLRRWREDFPSDFRSYQLHKRSYWNTFT